MFWDHTSQKWRVYYIFTNPKPKRKASKNNKNKHKISNISQGIRDWQLGIFVAVIMIIDMILIGVVAALPYTWNPALLVPNEEHLSEETGVRWILDKNYYNILFAL